MKNFLLLTSLIGFSITETSAQLYSAQMVKGGLADAQKIANAYFVPVLDGWAAGLGNGWYNTARTLDWTGFEITASGGVFNVPTGSRSYDPMQLLLENAQPASANNAHSSPTLLGENKPGPLMNVYYKTGTGVNLLVGSFNLPNGFDYHFFPLIPSIQCTFGLPKSTEIAIRFIPNTTISGFKENQMGFGIKHNLRQWISPLQKWKVDVALLYNWCRSNGVYAFDDANRLYPDDYNTPGAQPKQYYDNQRLELQTDVWMAGMVVSKEFGRWTPYTGFSSNSSSIRLKFLGNYPIPVYDPQYNLTGPTVRNVQDPISLSDNLHLIRTAVGLRFKLSPLNLSVEYSYAKYGMFSVSVGLGVQTLRKKL